MVVGFILIEYLHEVLCERIDVPNADFALDTRNEIGVGGTQDAQAESGHSIALGDAFHHEHVGICLEDIVMEEAVVLIAVGEINETLVNDETGTLLTAPCGQSQHISYGDEVAGRIVGVDDEQVVGMMGGEKVHQIICRVAIVGIGGSESDEAGRVAAVGVLLKGGAHDAKGAGQLLHEYLYQLGGSVAGNDIVLADSPALAGEQGIDFHAGGILGNKGAETGFQLINDARLIKIGIDQIAIVEHLGKTPKATVATIVFAENVILAGKESLGYVEVLLVINLIPFLAVHGKSLKVAGVKKSEDAQHILVILIAAHHLGIGLKERHIFLLRELTREFIDINSLIITAAVAVVKIGLGYEIDNVVVLVKTHHCSVHPALILSYESKVGTGIAEKHMEKARLKDEVALQEDRVVVLQILLGKGKGVDIVCLVVNGIVDILYADPARTAVDMADELIAFISYHYDHAAEIELCQLVKHTVDKRCTIDWHHALST